MVNYILKRLLLLPPLLIGITLLSFSLLKALPGDPVTALVGERASAEAIENIRKELGTDKGFIRQYIGYASLLIKGDFGRSYFTNRDVLSDIEAKFSNTILLALAAMLMAVPAGIILGFFSAYRSGGSLERFFNLITLAGLSVPVFWSGIMLMLLVSLHLKLLPPSGTGGIKFLVLPAFVLAVPAASSLARITRTVVGDVMGLPYVKTARIKGLSEIRINTVHILKNALIPIVTIIGLDFGSYLNGAVVTETIFGWDGIGRFTMEGVIKRDYPVIMGCIITGTIIFIIVNLLTDIVYHYLDPRIRLHGKGR